MHDTVFVFWIAMFYMGLLPVGLIAALVTFGTNAVYVKYKLLKHHKHPSPLDSSLVQLMATALPWMVYCASAMQLFYVKWAH